MRLTYIVGVKRVPKLGLRSCEGNTEEENNESVAKFWVPGWGIKSTLAKGYYTGPPAYMQPGGPVRQQPYAWVDYIPQSGTKNLALALKFGGEGERGITSPAPMHPFLQQYCEQIFEDDVKGFSQPWIFASLLRCSYCGSGSILGLALTGLCDEQQRWGKKTKGQNYIL